MKRVTWRFWTLTAGVILAYALLGIPFHNNGAVEGTLYKYGLGAVSVIVIAFVILATALGNPKMAKVIVRGRMAKWWKNNVGSNFVLLALAVLPITVPLAWVFWFDNGYLHSTWLAWAEVGGPPASALLYARQCAIWLNAAKEEGKEEDS